MNVRRGLFGAMYRRAATPDDVPWHREPPALLRAIAEQRGGGGALDLGCGTGLHAVYLAQLGCRVVGIDFVSRAVEAARSRAIEAGVSVEVLQCDVLDYEPDEAFDLVVDSGCLHHIAPSKVGTYRALLDRWLAPDGDYLLVHFLRRHALDWRLGPRRVPKTEILKRFAPLVLQDYDEITFDLAFPTGKSVAGVYWFRRDGITA